MIYRILFSTLPETFIVSAAWCSASVRTAAIVTIVCAIVSYNAYKSLV